MFRLEALLNNYFVDYGIMAVDLDMVNGKLTVEITKNNNENIEEVINRLQIQLNSIVKTHKLVSEDIKFKVEYTIVQR